MKKSRRAMLNEELSKVRQRLWDIKHGAPESYEEEATDLIVREGDLIGSLAEMDYLDGEYDNVY